MSRLRKGVIAQGHRNVPEAQPATGRCKVSCSAIYTNRWHVGFHRPRKQVSAPPGRVLGVAANEPAGRVTPLQLGMLRQ